MTAYMIVEMSIRDAGWTAAYRRDVPPMIAGIGGRYLALPRAPERLEGNGELPEILALIEFPSVEVARQFMASPAYAPYARARQAAADTTIYLADGVPSAPER
jgi:uncharacterized protein (DUF1330 family)